MICDVSKHSRQRIRGSCVAAPWLIPPLRLTDAGLFPASRWLDSAMTTRCGCEVTSLWDVGPSFRASLSSLTRCPFAPGWHRGPPLSQLPGEAPKRGLPVSSWAHAWRAALSPLSAPREGYNNPAVSGENLIGLSRARRPHNAIFVNFEGDEVPERPMEAAVQTWKKVCTNPVDHRVEEELRKVCLAPRPPPVHLLDPALVSDLLINSRDPSPPDAMSQALPVHALPPQGWKCSSASPEVPRGSARSRRDCSPEFRGPRNFLPLVVGQGTHQLGHLLCARPGPSSPLESAGQAALGGRSLLPGPSHWVRGHGATLLCAAQPPCGLGPLLPWPSSTP